MSPGIESGVVSDTQGQGLGFFCARGYAPFELPLLDGRFFLLAIRVQVVIVQAGMCDPSTGPYFVARTVVELLYF